MKPLLARLNPPAIISPSGPMPYSGAPNRRPWRSSRTMLGPAVRLSPKRSSLLLHRACWEREESVVIAASVRLSAARARRVERDEDWGRHVHRAADPATPYVRGTGNDSGRYRQRRGLAGGSPERWLCYRSVP